MKKLLFIPFLFLIHYSFSQAPDTLRVGSGITKVTVFSKGAQVTRKGKVRLQKGKKMLLMEGLPTAAYSGSFRVQGIPNCTILSVKHQFTEPEFQTKEPQEKALKAKIKAVEVAIKEINNKINVFDQEEKLLQTNSSLGSEARGVTIAEIREAADFFRLRLNEIKASRLKLETELETQNNARQELVNTLNNLGREDRKSYSELLLVVECSKSIDTAVEFTYYVPNAGWNPLYDFRVEDISKPLLIDYNANVFQSTGEDWKNVKLMLSTADPSQSGKLPVMRSWYLGGDNISSVPEPVTDLPEGAGIIKGCIRDKESREPVPFCNIVLERDGIMKMGTTSDMDGNYILRPVDPGKYDVKVSFVGYKPYKAVGVTLRPGEISPLDLEIESTAVEIGSYEVTDYKVPRLERDRTSRGQSVSSQEMAKLPANDGFYSGTVAGANSIRKSQGYSIIDSQPMELPAQKEVVTNYFSSSLRATITNLEYEIDQPYTIQADGEDYTVKIKQSSVPVEYEYHAIPKMDKDVFLTALVPDWSGLSLLPGKVSIYYQGTYSGESKIDSKLESDTLMLSLGRDNNVTVSREGNKEKNDKRLIGSMVKEDVGWNITVRNNKNVDIRIIVEDQYPLSVRKSIEVEVPEIKDAIVDALTGSLRWEVKLGPSEKKVLSYSYSVKYPRYEKLDLK